MISVTGVVTGNIYGIPVPKVKGICHMTKEDVKNNNGYPDNFIRVVFTESIQFQDNNFYEAVDVLETEEQLNDKLKKTSICVNKPVKH